MKKLSLVSSPDCLRVLVAYLLSLAIVLTPLAEIAAAARRSSANRAQSAPGDAPIVGAAALNSTLNPHPLAPFVAPVTATLTDNVTPNTTKVDKGATINYTATIANISAAQINGVEFQDVPDANTTLVAGSVHASPVAFDDSYNWVGNTQLDTSARGLSSITGNDIATTDSFTLNTTPAIAPAHGSVTISANGHFVYTPAAGYSGDDSFTYTIVNSTDASLTSTGTVTIHMPVRVWYLQAGAAGDGRSNTPSGNPAAISTSANSSTDILYIFSNASTLNGAFTLDNSQQLLGQGVNLVANSITLFTAGTAPAIANNAGDAVTLGLGNTLSGFNIADTSGKAITGSSVGSLNVSSLSINTTHGALDLTGVSSPSVNINISSITSSGGTNNIKLSGLNGTISLGSGALSAASAAGFVINGGAASVTYSGTLNQNTAGQKAIDISAITGGSVTLSGAIGSNGGNGVSVAGTGGTVTISGDMTLNNSNAVFSATGSGLTVNATGTNNTIGATNAATTTAVTITNATIGSSGVTFKSVSQTGGSKAITINNAGTIGTFTVTGTGATAGSGGTIQNTTGRSAEFISFNKASGNSVVLNNMTFSNNVTTNTSPTASNGTCGNHAGGGDASTCGAVLFFNSVTGIALTNTTIDGTTNSSLANGIVGNNIINMSLTQVAVKKAGNELGEDGLKLVGIAGTLNLDRVTITNNASNGVYAEPFTTTMNATVSGGTFGNNTAPNGQQGILVVYRGTGGTVTVQKDVSNAGTVFQNIASHAISVQSVSNPTAATVNFNIDSATFNSCNAAIDMPNGSTAPYNFNVTNNNLTNIFALASTMNAFNTGGAVLTGTFNNNTIGQVGVAGSGCNSAGCDGIRLTEQTLPANGSGTMNITVSNNFIHRVQEAGIISFAGAGSGKMKLTITGNTITNSDNLGGSALHAIHLESGALAADSNEVCATITNNSMSGASWLSGIRLTERSSGGTALIHVPGMGASTPIAYLGCGASAPPCTSASTNNSYAAGMAATVSSQGSVDGNNCSFLLLVPSAGRSTLGPLSRLSLDAFQSSLRDQHETLLSFNEASLTTKKSTYDEVSSAPLTVSSSGHAASLTQSQLDSIVRKAIDRWASTGLTYQQVVALRRLRFSVADLAGSSLGKTEGDVILIDRDAAGAGWFIDPNPQSNSSFDRTVSATRFYSEANAVVGNRVDLLTAIMHEMGHKLGLDDLYAEKDRDDLMYGYLTVGERRLPGAGAAKGLTPGMLPGPHFLALLDRESGAAESASGPLTNRKSADSGRHLSGETSNSKLESSTAAPPAVSPVDVVIGSLPAGKSCVVKFQVTVNNSFTPANTTQVQTQGTVLVSTFASTPTDDPDTATAGDATITQIARADLTLTSVTDSATTTTPGSTLTYVINYSNPGRSATGVKLTETVPSGTTFNSGASSPGWTCTPDNNAGSTCTNTIGSLANSATSSKNFAVTVNNPAAAGLNTIVDTASIADDGSYEPDINPGDNSGTDTDTLTAAPAFGTFTNSDGLTTTTPGSTLTYTINYANTGNQDATGVVLTETVPTATTFVSAGSSAWTGCANGAAGGTVCTIAVGNLAGGGGSGSATFVVVVNNPAAAGVNNIVNNTSITEDGANSASPATANASDTDTLTAAPDLSISKTPDVATASPNSTITYTLNYSNIGTQGASNVGVTETVPLNTTFVAAGSSTWTGCADGAIAGTSCTNAVGTLAGDGGGGLLTFKVKVNSSVPGGTTQITNVATIDDDHANGTDPNNANNTTGNVNVLLCGNPQTVTNTNDSGAGSLRQALIDLCAGGTINFTVPDDSTITLASELAIAKNVTIAGPANRLTISGGGATRVFNITTGTVNISNLTISNGKVTGSNGAGLLMSGGTVTLTGVLFTGNTTVNGGGGAVASFGGALNIYNSTIDGNTATNGGGVYHDTAGTLTLLNDTITNNTANGDVGAGPLVGGGDSGGVYSLNGVSTTARNTIISLNSAGTNADSSGITDSGNNIIGTDPQVASLANNGGPTRTRALMLTSPGIDAGDNTAASNAGLTTDQRGSAFPRIADSADADTVATVDIGAYELHPSIEDITDKTTAEDTPADFNFNLGDGTGALIISVTASSSNTTLVPNDVAHLSITGSGSMRTLAITPAADANSPADGTATITVTVTATNGQTAQDTFVLTVTEVNDAPVPVNDTVSNIDEDSGVYSIPRAALVANDGKGPANEVGQTLSITSVSNFTGGTAVINGPNIDFTPAADFNGAAGFDYTVQDNGTTNTADDFKSATAHVSFNINPINDPPSFTKGADQTVNKNAGAQTVSNWATAISPGPADEVSAGQTVSFNVSVTGTTGNLEFTVAPAVSSAGTLTYTATNGTSGTANVSVTAVDSGLGAPPPNSNTSGAQTFTITVTAVNQAPVNTVPASVSIPQDTLYTFTGGVISVADVDAAETDNVISVALTSTNGTMNLSGVAGLNFTSGSNGSAAMTVEGTIPDLNTALNNMTFTPMLGYTGAASIQMVSNDLGKTGTGGPQSDTDTINITVTPGAGIFINEILFNPPGTDAPNEYIELRGPANTLVPTGTYLVAIEGDAADNPGDVQTIINLSGLSFGSNGFLVLLQNGNTYTTQAGATVVTSTTTGFGGLPGGIFQADGGATDIEDASATFMLIQTAVAPMLTDDVDVNNDGTPDGAVFAGWNVRDSIGVLDGTDTGDRAYGAINFSNNTGTNGTATGTTVLTTFTAGYIGRIGDSNGSTAADWVASGALGGAAPNWTLGVAAQTEPAGFASKALNHIGASNFANLAPVNSVPAAQNVNEDFTLTFNTGNANLISISDPDAGGADMKVTLTSVNGTMSLSGTAGLTFTPPGAGNDGTNDTQMIFTGTIANINAALNGMTFTPTGDFFSPPVASLTILTEDQGNTGVGGNQTDSDTVNITVNPINDPPSFVKGANQMVNEDAGPQTVVGWATGMSQGPGESGQTLTFNVSVSGTTGNLAFSSAPAINSSTGTLTYTTAANTNGTATINVSLSDNGSNVAPNSNTSGVQQFTITVNPINDAPTFQILSNPPAVNEDAGAQTVNSFASNFQPGPASATDELVQTLVGYTLTANGTTGNLAFTSGPAINTAGQLTYTPTANTSGTATFNVVATDNGSGVAPNVNQSAPVSFTITVNSSNDPPTFTKGVDQTTFQNSGPQTVTNWATNMSPGPADEAGQTLTFNVTGNTNAALFSAAPAINATTGTLTYTGANNASGNATITITLSDNGGTANGGNDTSAPQTFLITINPCSNPVIVTSANDSGAGSLRSAIANVCDGGTINFNPALNGQTITLTGGELLLNKNVTISGPGANLLTVSGNNASRIFNIAAGKIVGISGLTITSGNVGGGNGGGVLNAGTLTLTNCAVTANTGGGGGGLANAGGATMTVIGSTISGNTAPQGAGILNGSTLTLINSTLSGNTGEGLSNGSGAVANLTNDTSSGNSVRGITSNPGATTNIRNSVVVNTPGASGDVQGNFISQGNNLIGKRDGSAGLTNGVNNDQVGTIATPLNAFLAVLGNYGGPTQTHALLPGSTAINAGNNCVTDVAHCGDANIPQLTTDQRGLARQVNGTVDLGAFESRGFSISATSGTPQSSAINTGFGSPLLATVNSAFAEPVNGGQVTFTAPGAGASATFTGGVTVINSSLNASGQSSTAATANGTAGGPYNVTANSAGITSPANFSLTNQKGNQTITFGALVSKTFGDPDFSVSATASSGLAVSFGASGNCTVLGNSVHLTGGGSCTITASQTGDTNYNPAPNVPQSFTIAKAASTTALGSSINPSNVTQSVTFTATVTGPAGTGTPIGTVTFKDGGNVIACTNAGGQTLNASGIATCQTASLTAGSHTITADYSGDANFAVSTGTTNQVVNNLPLVSFAAATYTVNEADGVVHVVINRNGDTSVPFNVDYATDDTGASTNCSALSTGLASSRCDFTMLLGTLKFAANETQKTIDIPINRDAFSEGPENFLVVLSNATNGALFVGPSPATVTINDSNVPSPNAIDDTDLFVKQQYHDFLDREPDAPGLAFWTDNINKCMDPTRIPPEQTVAQCLETQRIITSAAFFLSIEFMQTGTFVRSFYVAGLNRPNPPSSTDPTADMPSFNEWLRDTQAVQRGVVVGQGNWQATLDANRLAFMQDFVMRAEFVGLYPTTDTPTQYVNKIYQHALLRSPSSTELSNAVSLFGSAPTAGDATARGRALLQVTQAGDFISREMPRTFVQMEYFGYLRRNPNDPPDNNFSGYNFWLNKLNQFNGDFLQAEMVKAFINSSEYRRRFGP